MMIDFTPIWNLNSRFDKVIAVWIHGNCFESEFDACWSLSCDPYRTSVTAAHINQSMSYNGYLPYVPQLLRESRKESSDQDKSTIYICMCVRIIGTHRLTDFMISVAVPQQQDQNACAPIIMDLEPDSNVKSMP
jgi:hypothetical protein